MLFVLIATVACGLGAAGLVLVLGRLGGGRAPRWMVPAAAGLAMFAFTLWNEYSWYARARADLPQGAVIARTYEHRSPFQPWTLAFPRVAQFAALDMARAQRADGLMRVPVLLVERFAGLSALDQLFDCDGLRRGTPRAGGTVEWVSVTAADPLLAAACGAEGAGGTD